MGNKQGSKRRRPPGSGWLRLHAKGKCRCASGNVWFEGLQGHCPMPSAVAWAVARAAAGGGALQLSRLRQTWRTWQQGVWGMVRLVRRKCPSGCGVRVELL